MLTKKILPLIAGAIGRGAVRPTGCEDFEELKAEGCAMAAAMLDSTEARGKTVTPGNIAYFAIQSLRSGRRSGYAGNCCVLSAGAQIAGNVTVMSMDEPLGIDDDDEELTLHSALAAPGEDAGMEAGRHLDWADVMPTLDERRKAILAATAAGQGPNEIAQRLGVSSPRAFQLRGSIGNFIQDAWRTNGIAEVATPPAWRAGMRAASERRSARAERAW
jgi:DNA-binding CsgD family transcriptional regulator